METEESRRAVCTESTLESAGQRNPPPKKVVPPISISNDKSTSKGGSKLACESTIESSLRRDFIRKAALLGGAAAVGTTLLGSRIIPESSASSCTKGSSALADSHVVYYCPTGIAIEGLSCTSVGVAGASGVSCGVTGHSCKSIGVAGGSCIGIGVEGSACYSAAIPLVAKGAPCQSANLQQWRNNSCTPLSVVNKCGWFGIGICSPATTLQVNGSIGAKVVTPSFSTSPTYCVGDNCFAVLVNATSAAKTVNLPKAIQGMILYIKNTGTDFAVTIKPKSGDTIEGATSKSLKKKFGVQLIAGGNSPATWWIISYIS